MGFFKVAGTIVKGVAKGVGFITNEVVKEATGIDIKSELEPLQILNEECKQAVNDIKNFEANSREFIEKHGIDIYNNELELLKRNKEVVFEDMKYAVYEKRDELTYAINENAEKYRAINDMKEYFENMSDKSLQVLLKRKNLGKCTRYLLEQECQSRGIAF